MTQSQKFLTSLLWIAAAGGVLLLIGLSAARRGAQATSTLPVDKANEPLPVLFNLPTFSLLDQDGKAFTDSQLRGHAWLGAFVFTHCAGPCPMIFGKMASMQRAVPNPNIKLVTFTVDPERDTPEVLKKKSQDLGADATRWSFLTGDKEPVTKLLRDMLQPIPGVGDDPLMHDTHFYLFDAAGQCRGRYSVNLEGDLARLAKDAEMLAAQADKLAAKSGEGKSS